MVGKSYKRYVSREIVPSIVLYNEELRRSQLQSTA